MYHEMTTPRLILRPLDISDLATTHEYASDPENTAYMMFLPNNTLAESRSFLEHVTAEWQMESPGSYEFAMVYQGRHIGAVSVAMNEARTEGEMGWIVNKKYWRQGLTYEAAVAVRDFALNVLKLTRLVAQCDTRNEASFRLMQKLGFILEVDKGIRTYPKTGEIACEYTCALNAV